MAKPVDLVIFGASGDLTQRARRNEFHAARLFVNALKESTPVLVSPGNHDVTWWAGPFHIGGRERIYRKYIEFFGPDLAPTLQLPRAIIVSCLTSHGLTVGSMTWNLRDLTVKGHLPGNEFRRAQRRFSEVPESVVRVLVVHHNVLRGEISDRMGLARWRSANVAMAMVASRCNSVRIFASVRSRLMRSVGGRPVASRSV